MEFKFEVPHAEEEPLARQVWGIVAKPSGTEIRVPAFWIAADSFVVRIFPDERGRYRLMDIEETRGDSTINYPLGDVARQSARIRPPNGPRFIRIDPQDTQRFVLDDGTPYVPIGGNLPWLQPPDSLEARLVPYYRVRLAQFAESGLNWARIWMVHWSRLNLDWLEEDLVEQPVPGKIVPDVARNWDRIIEIAEKNGVHVQLVLQHHGQFSTETNPKWHFNPWNVDNQNGFLHRPSEFFTSERARQLTKQKYRYVVARWGYSPAIMAWELFNEVHWVDAMRFDFNEQAVAEWHDEMAEYLRSIDVHRHLVTTSTDNIRSPIYASVDYLQPHIYAVNMIDNMRYVDPAYREIGKPLFFGEFGDDHMPLTDDEKRTGVTIIPPIWAGIMGSIAIPPQTWFIERLVRTGNLSKLEAVASFLEATKIAERDDLVPFSPQLEGPETVPLVVRPGFVWMHRPDPVVDVATDGREPASLALVPGVLIADSIGRARGFAEQVTFRLDFPKADTVVVSLRLRERGAGGTTVSSALDGNVVATYTWPRADSTAAGRSASLAIEVPAGPHELVVRNSTGPAWFHVDSLSTSFDVPVIGAVGKRSDDFIALWIWNREGVFAAEPAVASAATLLISDVPVGQWRIEWWDTNAGRPGRTDPLEHRGGTLRLETPPVERHAAVVITRTSEGS